MVVGLVVLEVWTRVFNLFERHYSAPASERGGLFLRELNDVVRFDQTIYMMFTTQFLGLPQDQLDAISPLFVNELIRYFFEQTCVTEVVSAASRSLCR